MESEGTAHRRRNPSVASPERSLISFASLKRHTSPKHDYLALREAFDQAGDPRRRWILPRKDWSLYGRRLSLGESDHS